LASGPLSAPGFFYYGGAAANHAGPAIPFFCGRCVGCLFAGLCYAEFASMIPVAVARTLIRMQPWVIHCLIIDGTLCLEYAVGAAR